MQDTRGHLYVPQFLRDPARGELLAWLGTLRPLWELRFPTNRPPPRGETQRALLRPVYWLGNWQFACLGYYDPKKRQTDCAVTAEPFPPLVQSIVADMERRIRKALPAAHIPKGWALNTCLINFYGDRLVDGAWEDRARVGDHRDYEPGPVGSLSLGERALFQFVSRRQGVQKTEWLEDGSLTAFSGPLWKDELFHRVQRVERKTGAELGPVVDGFRTRRINLTFRFVPSAHVVPFGALGARAQGDVRGYVETLATASPFWQAAL